MASADLTWSWSPTNSRLVRGLLYLLVAVAGGWLIFPMYTLVHGFISGYLSVHLFPTALLVLLVLLILVYWLPRIPVFQKVLSQNNILREFTREIHPLWVAISAIIGGGVYVLIFLYAPLTLFLWVFGGLSVSLIGAYMLSSEGAITPETRTLQYNGNEIDLDFLADVDRLSVGDRTLLWLSFEPGYASSHQRLYVVPTTVVDQAWEIFQTGIAHSVEAERSDRPVRALSVIGALGFGGVAVGLFALLSWAGAPMAISVLAALMFAAFGLALSNTAIRTV